MQHGDLLYLPRDFVDTTSISDWNSSTGADFTDLTFVRKRDARPEKFGCSTRA
jgi:hypothetical protein